MTEETALEVRKPDQAVAPIPDAANLRLLATNLISSGFFRGIQNVAQAMAVVQLGSELGIGPMNSLRNITPIKGQLTMSARLIMSLAASRAGVTWKVIELNDKRCEMVFSRPGWSDMTVSFTLEEAKNAGLVKPDSAWEKNRQDMLFKSCGTRGIRRIAMDATEGLYSTEEIQGATIEDTGEALQGVDTGRPDKREDELPPEASPAIEDVADADDEPPPSEHDEDLFRQAHTAEDEKARQGGDATIETAILSIKATLDKEGVDQKSFKEWLFGYQNRIRPTKAYIGKIGKNLSFHQGRRDDVLKLSEFIDAAIKMFRTGKDSKNGNKS